MNLRVVKKIIEVNVKRELVYPLNLISTINPIIKIFLTILAWSIIGPALKLPISHEFIVPYFVLVGLFSIARSRAIPRRIARDIRLGRIGVQLARPLNIELNWVLGYWSSALFYRMPALILLIIWLLMQPVPLSNILMGILISGIGMFAILQLYVTIGLLAFWVEDPWGFEAVVDAIIVLFSGQLVPLMLFPKPLQQIAAFLPFRLIGYIPAMISLGLIDPSPTIVLSGMLWCISLWILKKLVWKKGIEKLSVNGI